EAVFREGEDDVIETVGEATDLVSALRELFEQVDEYGYVAVQAYLDRLADAESAELRPLVSADAGVQSLFGFGPDYMRSNGQYHKGGRHNGVFLQITAEARTDILVLGLGYGFAQLQRAQAAGDASALRNRGRPVLRVHLLDRSRGLEQLREAITMISPIHYLGVDSPLRTI